MPKKEEKGKIKLTSHTELAEILSNIKEYKLYMFLSERLLNMSALQLKRKSILEIEANIEQGQIYYEKL